MELVPLANTRADHDQFLDLLEEYWDELQTFSGHPEQLIREQYRRHLYEPGSRRFVWAVEAGERIGFCVYLVVEHWYRSDIVEGYIDEVYVRPTARRAGAGRELMLRVLDRCREEGCEAVRLHVLPRNTRARKFWEGIGFEEELIKMSRPIENPLPRVNRTGAELRKAIFTHLAAIQARDLDGFMRSLTQGPITVVLPYGKLLEGRAEILSSYREWFADRSWTWDPKVLQTRELGDVALVFLGVNYRDVDRHQIPNQVLLRVTLTFAREAGGWRLVHAQNTAAR